MAFDENYNAWLVEYRQLVGTEPVSHRDYGYQSSTRQYNDYYHRTGLTSLPNTYIGEIQGFDLFFDSASKIYMVKYNDCYSLIQEELFDLAYTAMDAGELNAFLCRALFDGIDVRMYLTDYLKEKKQYQYQITNHGKVLRKTPEELQAIREAEEQFALQEIASRAESNAHSGMIQQLRNSPFWGLLIYEEML